MQRLRGFLHVQKAIDHIGHVISLDKILWRIQHVLSTHLSKNLNWPDPDLVARLSDQQEWPQLLFQNVEEFLKG